MKMKNPVFCALDTPEIETAVSLTMKIKDYIGGLKIGLEFFMANGPDGYREVAKLGLPIFLDVKLHDIPNTVKKSIHSLLQLKPDFITIHISGGPAMMRAAADAAISSGENRPKLLGVTVLTSLDSGDLKQMGHLSDMEEQVLCLTSLAKTNGLDGVVCSSAEVAMLREACGPDFILMVPGIRPEWVAKDDQKRVMTPKEALKAGATYLVIGRPITAASDPAAAAQRIAEEIAA